MPTIKAEENHHGQLSSREKEAYSGLSDQSNDVDANKAKRMAFILPTMLSAIYYVVDCFHLIKEIIDQVNANTFDLVQSILSFIELSLGYFPVTFISAVAAAFLQQLLFKQPAGLDKNKIEGLFYFFIGYIVFFAAYLTAKGYEWDILSFIVLTLTVWFGLWIWKALEIEVRKPEAGQSQNTDHFVNNMG